MANLTTGEEARLNKLRGKAKSLTIGTRIRNLEQNTDAASAGQIKVVAGASITGGELVYFSSWNATNSCFDAKLADANAGFPAIAVALADITSAAVGYVTGIGRIDKPNTGGNVNTNSGAVGDAVFLSDTPGGWSLTESTTMPQLIGYVSVVSTTVGVISVNVGSEIPDHTHATSNGMGGAFTMTTVTDLDVGADAVAGTLDIFPASTTNSKIIIQCTDIGAGSRNLTITNAAQAAARTYTIPDAGASASFVMTGTTAQSILGDIALGSDTVAGKLTVNSVTTGKGSTILQHVDNNAADAATTIQNGQNGAAAVFTLPTATGTLLGTTGNPAATVTLGGDLTLGSDTVAGELALNSVTASKGSTLYQHVDDAGNNVTTINNYANTGAATTVTLPAFTGNVMVYESAQRWIPLKITDAREITSNATINLAGHGGIMALDSNPTLTVINGDANGCLILTWVATDVNPIGFTTPLPPDLDVASDLVIHFRARIDGTAGPDTVVVSCDAYFNEGDTKVEDDSAAITGTTWAAYTITIGNADITAGDQTLSFELTLAAHANDGVEMSSIWIEYTGKALTS